MTPLDTARLDFDLHASLLQRALGRGGATVDLERAYAELIETEAALRELAKALVAVRTRRSS